MKAEAISAKSTAESSSRLHLLYHELRPDRSEYSYVVGTNEFQKHVELFLQLRKAWPPVLLPEITFDDGHMSNFEYALPMLQERGLIARFFITVGWTGKKPGYMRWSELRSLRESGQLIGAHGWSHTLLTHCSRKELVAELDRARLILEDKLGTSITTMSLPGGRFDKRVLSACQAAGYTQVYTSIPRAERDPLGSMVGRLNIRGDMPLKWIRDLFESGGSTLSILERQYRLKAAAKTLMGDQLYAKLWALVNRKETEPSDEDSEG